MLRYLSTQSDLPWLCAGDFNEILKMEEKCGGPPRSRGQIEAFRKAVEDLSIMDIGFLGPEFTWCNGRKGNSTVRERLDRALADSSWCNLFPKGSVHHLSSSYSDHLPIRIETVGQRKGMKR